MMNFVSSSRTHSEWINKLMWMEQESERERCCYYLQQSSITIRQLKKYWNKSREFITSGCNYIWSSLDAGFGRRCLVSRCSPLLTPRASAQVDRSKTWRQKVHGERKKKKPREFLLKIAEKRARRWGLSKPQRYANMMIWSYRYENAKMHHVRVNARW